MDRAGLGVPGVAADRLVSIALASASTIFLLAMVSMVTNLMRAKFDAVSSWRTVVSLAAARARLLRAVPRQSMMVAGVERTAWALPNGPPPPDACSWHWRLRWARWKATFHALHVQLAAGRPFQSFTSYRKCWAARTAAKAIITSLTSATGMPARFTFF